MTTETGKTTETGRKKGGMPPLVKLAVDLGPLVLFFFANAKFGLMTATGAFMVATFAALSVSYAIERRLAPMPVVTGVFVLIFGGLTLYLDNELFIKLKPTIVNLIFAAILIAGMFLNRPFLRMLFQDAFTLTDDGWRKLTYRWAGFFLFLALLNEVIWRNFSTDFWVAFKVWGNIPITFAFAAAQVPLIARYQPRDETGPATAAETER